MIIETKSKRLAIGEFIKLWCRRLIVGYLYEKLIEQQDRYGDIESHWRV